MNTRKVLILFVAACIIFPGFVLGCTGSDNDQKSQPAPAQKFPDNSGRTRVPCNNGAHDYGAHGELNVPTGGNDPCPLAQRYENWWGNRAKDDPVKDDKAGNKTFKGTIVPGNGAPDIVKPPVKSDPPSPISRHNESLRSDIPAGSNADNKTAVDEARIAALEKQVAQQNQELERQGDILNQIMSFLAKIFGWKT